MEKIKKVLCLGNQTVDTDRRSSEWAIKLKVPHRGLFTSVDHIWDNGVIHPDLASLEEDAVWELAELSDLIIMLDHPIDSYENYETYYNFLNLSKYLSFTKSVLFEGCNDPLHWITHRQSNSELLSFLQEKKFVNSRLVIQLRCATDYDEFIETLNQIAILLEKSENKWLMYKDDVHEPRHYEITRELLNFPQFVYLNPGAFANPSINITESIYRRWIQLYCSPVLSKWYEKKF